MKKVKQLSLLIFLLSLSNNIFSQCNTACQTPLNLHVVSILSGDVTYDWSDGPTAESWHYILKYGTDTLLNDTCYSKPLTINMDTFSYLGTYTLTVSAYCHEYAGSDLLLTTVFHNLFPAGAPKGIEMYAARDIADLSIYGIGIANDGGGTNGIEYTFPNVSVSEGSFMYLTNDSVILADVFSLSNIYESQIVDLNGNDAVELFENGVTVDYYGYPDIDGTGTNWDYPYWAHRICNTENDSTFHREHWYIPLPDSLIFEGSEINNDSLQAYPPFGDFGVSEGGESGSASIDLIWGCEPGGTTGEIFPFGTYNPQFSLDDALVGVPFPAVTGIWMDPNGNPHSNIIDYLVDDCGIYTFYYDAGNGCPITLYYVNVPPYSESNNLGDLSYCTNDTLFFMDLCYSPSASITFNGMGFYNLYDYIDLSNYTVGSYDLSEGAYGPCYFYQEYYNVNINSSPYAGEDSDTTICFGGHVFDQDLNLMIGEHDSLGAWVDLNSPSVIDSNGIMTVNQIGLYQFLYIVESGNCGTDTNYIFIDVSSCTNMDDLNRNSLKIYPNPNNGVFNIVTGLNSNTDIIITDLSGKVVYTILSNKSLNIVDLTSFNKGIYLVKVVSDSGIRTEKIIVE